jgi:hypothetical protein
MCSRFSKKRLGAALASGRISRSERPIKTPLRLPFKSMASPPKSSSSRPAYGYAPAAQDAGPLLAPPPYQSQPPAYGSHSGAGQDEIDEPSEDDFKWGVTGEFKGSAGSRGVSEGPLEKTGNGSRRRGGPMSTPAIVVVCPA